MEVMVAVQSGTLLHAPRVQLKRRVSARRGGDYNEVPQAIQKKSRPSPSNFVTLSACKLLSEKGFGFPKAIVLECRVLTSHFPCDEVQNEAEIRGSTPVFAQVTSGLKIRIIFYGIETPFNSRRLFPDLAFCSNFCSLVHGTNY